MATAETTTLRDEPEPSGRVVYDAFTSYSHAADGLLAPRLQSALQRFAKPWWKRRALRVFRDETSLGANPHLWGSITKAMDESDWFVLLLSPDAANSSWVNQEIHYWREHKDPSRILPVLTDGTFIWSDGQIAGNAIPPSLKGVFPEEPRWVDLTFARLEEQLDLKNPRFSAAVADLASAIRGMPKDELESEEVKQHRRTIRIAWAAGMTVLLLGVAATLAAIYAINQSNEARAQRDEARRLAEAEARARDEAEKQARLARARELAAAAGIATEANPERGILLALQATGLLNDDERLAVAEPIDALRRALSASRVVTRLPGGDFVDYSRDGTLVVTGSGVNTAIWDAEGNRVRTLASPDGLKAEGATFSPDGSKLAVGYTSTGQPLIVLWDLSSGDPILSLNGPEFSGRVWSSFSPNGELLAAVGNSPGPVVVWDTSTGVERYRLGFGDDKSAGIPSFSPDGTMIAATAAKELEPAGRRVVIGDAATGVEINSLDAGDKNPGFIAFDPTGRLLAAVSQSPGSVLVWDVDTLELVASWVPGRGSTTLEWSPDGNMLAVSGNEGIARLYDPYTGDELMSLVGHDTAVWSLAFDPSGQRIAGAGTASDTIEWDITPSGIREVATLQTPYSGFHSVAYDTDGDTILIVSQESPASSIARLDAITGEILADIPDQLSSWPVNPLIAIEAELAASVDTDGNAALHNLKTFTEEVALPKGMFALGISPDARSVVVNPLDQGNPVVARVRSWDPLMRVEENALVFASFNPDGDLVSIYNGTNGSGSIIDTSSGAVLASFGLPDVPGDFSPSGSLLVVRTLDGQVKLMEVDALQAGTTPEEATVLELTAHNGAVLEALFSPDGSLIATWGLFDNHLRVWDTQTGDRVADLGTTDTGFAFGFHPNGRHLIAGDGSALRVFTVDVDELIEIARSRLTRGFTDEECATHRIDPCPDLETIRDR